jgi:hypothetical protein
MTDDLRNIEGEVEYIACTMRAAYIWHPAAAQDKSVDHVVSTIERQLAAARDNPQEPSRVFVISTYVIGKERILLAVRLLRAACIS